MKDRYCIIGWMTAGQHLDVGWWCVTAPGEIEAWAWFAEMKDKRDCVVVIDSHETMGGRFEVLKTHGDPDELMQGSLQMWEHVKSQYVPRGMWEFPPQPPQQPVPQHPDWQQPVQVWTGDTHGQAWSVSEQGPHRIHATHNT